MTLPVETGAAETPLWDLLRRIPRDAVYQWTVPEADRELWQLSSCSSPIGRLAHEAADRLAALARYEGSLGALPSVVPTEGHDAAVLADARRILVSTLRGYREPMKQLAADVEEARACFVPSWVALDALKTVLPVAPRGAWRLAGGGRLTMPYDTKPADSTTSVESIAKIIRRAMQDHSTPATVRSEKAAEEIAARLGQTLARASDGDPMEALTGRALKAAGLVFITDHEPETPARLDFYLPAEDLHIEVKRFHSDRVAEQLTRAENIILLQGGGAVRFFADLVKDTAEDSVGTDDRNAGGSETQ